MRDFSREAFELATLAVRAELSREWRTLSATIDAAAPADETTARRLAESFAAYLKACKDDQRALSTLPPGRFLMPGDLDGSPALTFAPLLKLAAGHGRVRFAAGDDGAPLRGLQDACRSSRSSASTSPGSTARSC